MSDTGMSRRKKRRRLPPSEKYELWISVLTGQATQREAAERFKVDRSTVVHVCKVASKAPWMRSRRACQDVRGRPRRRTGSARVVGIGPLTTRTALDRDDAI